MGKTFLILDVESGSVGSALAYLPSSDDGFDTRIKFFGETRISLPLAFSRDSAQLARLIERAAHEALIRTSLVAARLRQHKTAGEMGMIRSAVLFFGAPWGAPDLSAGKPRFYASLKESLAGEAAGFAGEAPLSFYTGADAAVYGARAHTGEPLLLANLRGEVTELVLLAPEGVAGYATIPLGTGTLLRTLQSHGQATAAEARSMLRLALSHETPLHEPLGAAGVHFVEQFAAAAEQLIPLGKPEQVLVLADAPVGEWFARVLGEDNSLGALFPEGGVVRALGAHHYAPHIAARQSRPDLHLMLDALYLSGKEH